MALKLEGSNGFRVRRLDAFAALAEHKYVGLTTGYSSRSENILIDNTTPKEKEESKRRGIYMKRGRKQKKRTKETQDLDIPSLINPYQTESPHYHRKEVSPNSATANSASSVRNSDSGLPTSSAAPTARQPCSPPEEEVTSCCWCD